MAMTRTSPDGEIRAFQSATKCLSQWSSLPLSLWVSMGKFDLDRTQDLTISISGADGRPPPTFAADIPSADPGLRSGRSIEREEKGRENVCLPPSASAETLIGVAAAPTLASRCIKQA